MRRFALGLCTLLWVAASLHAEEPTHGGKTAAAWATLLEEGSVGERREAAKALQALGGGEGPALHAVARALAQRDEEVRSVAYQTLLAREDHGRSVVKTVVPLLGGPLPREVGQRYVYRYLLVHDPASVVRNKHAGIRKSGLEVLLFHPTLMSPPLFTMVLGRSLKRYEPSIEVRDLALGILRDTFSNPDRVRPYMEPHRATFIQVLRVAAKDESATIRTEAMRGLADLAHGQPREAVEPLLASLRAGLEDPDADVRGAAFSGLAHAGHACPEAAGAVLAALRDEEVFGRAVDLLPLVGPLSEETVLELHRALATKESTDLWGLLNALGDLGERALPYVPTMIGLFRQAAKATGRRGFRNIDVLLLRDIIAQNLGDIGPKAADALPDLEAAFASGEQPGGAYAYAMLRLGSTQRDAAIAHLVRVAVEGKHDVLRAQSWLGWLGADAAAALPALQEHLRTGTPAVRTRVAKTLAGMGPVAADAAPLLRTMRARHGESDPSFAAEADKALRALQAEGE